MFLSAIFVDIIFPISSISNIFSFLFLDYQLLLTFTGNFFHHNFSCFLSQLIWAINLWQQEHS